MKNNIVNICYQEWVKGGISVDVDVISSVLRNAGFVVYYNGHNIRFKNVSKIKKLLPKLSKIGFLCAAYLGLKKFAINLHLEVIQERDIELAKRNIMIANLEWLRDRSYDLLPKMDMFFCKTLSAKNFFDKKGMPAVYISFSSVSPYNDHYEKKENSFIHIAGSSVVKGTVSIARTWSRHPEWPKLTILARPIAHIKVFESDNLEIIGDFLERDELEKIQNTAEIQLCLSEAEGFGHYICEALSCGAIVVTVDGEPMNELVRPSRGVLVRVDQVSPMYRARKFTFKTDDFESKIEEILVMTKKDKEKIKLNAKQWFSDNDSFFKEKFISEIHDCILDIEKN